MLFRPMLKRTAGASARWRARVQRHQPAVLPGGDGGRRRVEVNLLVGDAGRSVRSRMRRATADGRRPWGCICHPAAARRRRTPGRAPTAPPSSRFVSPLIEVDQGGRAARSTRPPPGGIGAEATSHAAIASTVFFNYHSVFLADNDMTVVSQSTCAEVSV